MREFFNRHESYFVFLSIACYIVSFALPVVDSNAGEQPREIVYGIEAFMTSMIPYIWGRDPTILASWLANIGWLVGIGYYGGPRRELAAAGGAAGVGLASLQLSKPGLMVGYYAWLASMYFLLIGTLLYYWRQENKPLP
jgi:hypothetical protein